MIQKLDYLCQGRACIEAHHCRRWMMGEEAKNCALPYAAYDMRDTVACDGFLPRIMAPVRDVKVDNANVCGLPHGKESK